jgi:hypothetical protein
VEEEDINMANTFKFGNENWAVKNGKVLAYNDENNAFKPLPFTFARSSSATRVDNEGLIKTTDSGFARIDFLNNTSGHLLLEPQMTNELRYSNDFSQWDKNNNSSVTLNVLTSPDGTQNAAQFTYDGTSNGRVEEAIAVDNGSVYTFSIYLKNKDISDPTQVFIGFSSAPNEGEYVTITNEWQRFSTTQTANGSTEFPRVSCDLAGSLYAFGAQVEKSSFATSYIATNGSTVTRAAETCNSAGNSTVFNDSEGVLYAEISAFINGGGGDRTISISDGSQSNSIQLLLHNTASRINFRVRDGGSLEVNISDLETNQTLDLKVACKYKSGDYSLFVNGTKKATTTSGNLPTGLNQLAFDDGAYNDFYGKVKNIQVYNTALTDAELIELTS